MIIYYEHAYTQMPLVTFSRELLEMAPAARAKALIKIRLRIPVEFGHLFRFISDTRSDLIRTVIPIQFGHLFRFYSDSDSGMNSDRF